jgi:hypothetical protein
VAIKFVIDNKGTMSHLAGLMKIPAQVSKEAGDYFRDITPIRTGNARANTYTTGETIRASYQYASKLDDGSSKQAPKGMTEPTIAFIDKRFKELVEKK